MSVRKIPFTHNEFYHIYNRGNSKQTIFHDYQDYCRFVNLLFLSNGENGFKIQFIKANEIYNFDRGRQLVNIGAYCLMPNHFHILLNQRYENGISKFMQKISTGYSMYNNIKHERTGTLFEGKFKAEHIKDDRHLKYLFSYIHLNPVKLIDPNWKEMGIKNKDKALSFLSSYAYSSYLDFLNYNRPEVAVLNSETFPSYFLSESSFKKEIFEWINYTSLQARPV